MGASKLSGEKSGPEYSDLVIYCPSFLDDYYAEERKNSIARALSDHTSNVITRRMSEMETKVMKEHIMLHELFYCSDNLKIPNRSKYIDKEAPEIN